MSYGLSAATGQRARYEEAMQRVAPGAQVTKYGGSGRYTWAITATRHCDGGVELSLRCGRRTAQVLVPICITGPCLADAGLRSVADAPRQMRLRGMS